ncbi:hypothetical protein B0H13DRAFT_1921714 [Mycena leptocephala]|nr:hypothetical protein B0H13DRAFT_1921714 [Mycena leptocephala]
MSIVDLDEYETPQPRLSLYNEVAIVMMNGRPYDETWDHILSTLDVLTLFKVALRSSRMFEVVAAYVQAHTLPAYNKNEYRTGAAGDVISKLSLELFPIIFAHLTFADRIRLSCSSKKLRAVCARENQATVSRLLRKFGLCPADIRFMQSATRSTISGVAIAHLIHDDIFPHTLEFHVPSSTYSWVLRFFALVSPYHGWPKNDVHDNDGVAHITKFLRPSSEAVYVMKSRTDSALDIIPHAPFTNMFLAVTHYGMWLGYPKTTLSGLSFPSRDMIHFGDPHTPHRMKSVLLNYVDAFRFQFALRRPHTCGLTFECPVTPRTTVDDGCLNLFFPGTPFGRNSDPASVYPTDTALSWSLDARGCGLGMSRAPQGVHVARRDDGSLPIVCDRILARSLLAFSSMAFPLLLRLEVDRASKPSLYLVNSKYDVDFVSTRDRTTPAGGLWTFKTIEDDDPYLLSSVKTCLGPHLTHIFGQVDSVKQTNTGFVVRLSCPEEVSCRTRQMYAIQVARLQEILEGEQASAGGEIVSSWFFTSAQGEPCPPMENCFYVRVSSYVAESMFTPGTRIELVIPGTYVTFLYFAKDAWIVRHPSVNTNAIPLFMCHDDQSHDPCTLFPSTMSNTYLSDYALRGQATLGYARYGRDFLPTRERSLGGGSLYTGKAVHTDPEMSEVHATEYTRGRLRKFLCLAFGEVASVLRLDKDAGIVVKLVCPRGASCVALSMFGRQLDTLEDIVVQDANNSDVNCISSWFNPPDSDQETDSTRDHFWTFAVGKIIDAMVSLQRIDTVDKSDNTVRLRYSLLASHTTTLVETAIPVKGRNYICDDSSAGCEHCK